MTESTGEQPASDGVEPGESEASEGPAALAAAPPTAKPPAKPWRPPVLLVAVAVVLLFLFVQCGLGSVVSVGQIIVAALRDSPLPMSISAGWLSVVNMLSFFIVVTVGVLASRQRLRDLFPMALPNPLLLLPMILSVIGVSLVMSEVDNVTRTILPMPDVVTAMFSQLLGGSVITSFVALVLVAPFTEELLFRGLILRTLVERYSPLLAIVISAFLFAVLHMNPWQFANPIALGLLLGWWCWRTRSLWPGLLGHAVTNGMAWYMSNFEVPFDVPGYTGEFGAEVAHQPWWFTGIGLGLAAGGVLVTWLIFRFIGPIRTSRRDA